MIMTIERFQYIKQYLEFSVLGWIPVQDDDEVQ